MTIRVGTKSKIYEHKELITKTVGALDNLREIKCDELRALQQRRMSLVGQIEYLQYQIEEELRVQTSLEEELS